MFKCLKEYIKGRDYVFKKELETFTGGVITQHTFTNLTHKGATNLPKSFVIGHKVAYKIDDVITWLEENTELINFDTEEDNE